MVPNRGDRGCWIVACSAQLARKVAAQAKVRIRWVVNRVKMVLKIMRCFACHDFGHMAARCPINRTVREICRRCKGEEHSIRESKVPVSRCLYSRRRYKT